MSLKDDLGSLQRGPRTFQQWLDAASVEDRKVAIDAMGDTGLRIDQVVNVFRKNGIPCTPETVKSYRDAG